MNENSLTKLCGSHLNMMFAYHYNFFNHSFVKRISFIRRIFSSCQSYVASVMTEIVIGLDGWHHAMIDDSYDSAIKTSKEYLVAGAIE